MVPNILKKIVCIDLAIFVLIVDQISKWWIVEKVMKPLSSSEQPLDFLSWLFEKGDRLEFHQVFVAPFFNLVMVWNKGVSFGLFNDHSDYGPLLLTALSLALCVFFILWFVRSQSLLQGAAMMMVIGGAIGNVIDRVRFGAVIDFLDIHVLGYHWPAFNIADSAIVCGIAIILFHSLFLDKSVAVNVKE